MNALPIFGIVLASVGIAISLITSNYSSAAWAFAYLVTQITMLSRE